MEENYHGPRQIVQKYMKACGEKAGAPFWKILLMGILAGGFISFGASSSSAAMHGISDVGIARVVAGCIFPVGLMLIILVGGELFTGDGLMIMGWLDKRYKAKSMIRVLLIVYFSNFIGAVLVAFLVVYSGQLDFSQGALGAFTIKVALGKANLTFLPALTSGILCNMLVCVAVMMSACAKDVVGKVWAIFFPILAFVIGGFEHCIANMYYIPAGIFAMSHQEYVDKAVELYGYTGEQLASRNWGNMIINNLLPVTIGNLIGGMVCVGLPLYYINRVKDEDKKEIKEFKELKEKRELKEFGGKEKQR